MRPDPVYAIHPRRERRGFSRNFDNLPVLTNTFILVLNPEKLPILESQKALTVLRQFNVPVAAAVINRVLPPEAVGEFLEHRRQQEARYLAEIESVFADLERHYLSLLPRDVQGIDSLNRIGRQLLGGET